MDLPRYIELLQRRVIPVLNLFYPVGCRGVSARFCHTSKKFVNKNHINMLELRGNFPNCNFVVYM